MYRIRISTKRHKTEPKEVLEMKRISKMITSVEGFHITFEQAKTELEILKLNNWKYIIGGAGTKRMKKSKESLGSESSKETIYAIKESQKEKRKRVKKEHLKK